MLKIRLQGTREDILWFQSQILEKNRNLEIKEISRLFDNKGTRNFFRNYIEINRVKRNK